jgi:hypothetical protein
VPTESGLRERLRPGTTFKRGTLAELEQLTRQFEVAAKKLDAVFKRLIEQKMRDEQCLRTPPRR